MAGLCEGGNEPPGSLKARCLKIRGIISVMAFTTLKFTGTFFFPQVVVITEDVQNVHLLLEYRPHIDFSLTCEHDPKLQEYCVCPQNMPQFDSEGILNQAPETNKPMILNGPTSRNREGSDQRKESKQTELPDFNWNKFIPSEINKTQRGCKWESTWRPATRSISAAAGASQLCRVTSSSHGGRAGSSRGPRAGGAPRREHWSRPTHLQYRYLYDYRHNYYNDVIDYLDRKTRGLNRDIPRAQTWAERVLRTYTKDVSSAANTSRNRDIELLTSIRACNNYYTYHSRDYLVRRYPALAL
ncbi:hypothetical protein ANN_16533 [Periplaneta americana]|uniref:Uncharacterized protein n=1 Tax=Periplaneta americana TaxID=6978 RepID=A0ABQ8SS31_PERAM|nr:hypothetical protein ANN_16533 [Periplaneta americana]